MSSCSEDEQFNLTVPIGIAFVHEGGWAIAANDCINPNGNYAVLIKTTSRGEGCFQPTAVEFSLNGLLYVVTFKKTKAESHP